MALDPRVLERAAIRHLKKYPNRRLYDCRESRYVTLAHVCELVRSGVTVSVTRARNRRDKLADTPIKDITREILLDVIAAQEVARPRLSTEDLRAMVYSGAPL